VHNQKQATLKVCPEQAQAARDAIAEIRLSDAAPTTVEVVADGRLEKNSCLIETEIGVVDASLDVQLEAIRKVLEKAFSHQ
jgi:type III secretion protein L